MNFIVVLFFLNAYAAGSFAIGALLSRGTDDNLASFLVFLSEAFMGLAVAFISLALLIDAGNHHIATFYLLFGTGGAGLYGFRAFKTLSVLQERA